MRGFDESCLTPAAPLTPHESRALREREHMSQTVFANYLNVTPNLVSKGGTEGGAATVEIAEYTLAVAASQIILLVDLASRQDSDIPF